MYSAAANCTRRAYGAVMPVWFARFTGAKRRRERTRRRFIICGGGRERGQLKRRPRTQSVKAAAENAVS
jgi:hypothetical protein